MGEFITISPNDIIINHIWYQICKIQPWEDRLLLYLTLRLTSKTWKNLVDSSHKWAHNKLHLLEFHFRKQIILKELHRSVPLLEECEPQGCGNLDGSDT
jgi:hypothetical protein